MKICVFGAGAVGGYLAARLLKAGKHEISVVARGEQLHAIASRGLTLSTAQEQFVVRPHAITQRAQDLPAQDVVFVTLKAHSQPAAAADIAALMGPSGAAVFINNGIPWWWNYRGAALPGAPLPLLDPDGALWTRVGPQRAIGCVVYSANEVTAPGVVRHLANNRWLLGELDGTESARIRAIAGLMREADLDARCVHDLRDRIWTKLLRNASLNSVCALTRLPVEALSRDAGLQALCDSIVDEIAAVASAHGCHLGNEVDIAKAAPRLGGALDGRPGGNMRPSMLQDVLSGRPTEVEAILGQVQAFARASGTPSPVLDVLVPLLRALSPPPVPLERPGPAAAEKFNI